MQSVSAALLDAIRNGDLLDAQPRLIAEWNQNRYAGISIVDNDPTDPSRYDASVVVDPTVIAPSYEFPISSIVAPHRPTRGIIKARASAWVTTQQYYAETDAHHGEEAFTAPNYTDRVEDARYYTVGADAPYKYWTSPSASLAGGSFPAGSEVRPYVIYSNKCWTNKIVVVFENTWANPSSYQIQVTTASDNSGWTTISSNVAPDSEGKVVLYRQANGTWGTTVYRDNATQIHGIRLVVNSIDQTGAHLSLIELSARLESDLSANIMTYESTFSMSEPNFITPLGKASSNGGSVSLSNIIGTGDPQNGLFNKDNVNSIYYGMIDHNVKFTMDLGYLIGGAREYVREFEMYSEQWGSDGQETIDVPLKDASKFLQEESAPKFFLEGVTVGEAVWRICDMVGFVGYEYDKQDVDPATIIPYFWSDGSETVWGLFQQIAEATQTAIFFDEYGKLRIQTRDAAYDTTRPISWVATATDLPGAVADVINIDKSNDFEANTVNVLYKVTSAGEDANGFPKMDVVWQPEGDFTLRSSNLVEAMNASQTSLRMTSEDALGWPYEGLVTLDGEIMRYKGKEYTYYNANGGTNTVYVNSLDEKNNIDRNLSDKNNVWKNSWTGRFNITKRGELQTSPRAHDITATGFSGRRHTIGSAATESWAGSFQHNRMASLIKVTTPSNWPAGMYYTLTTGSQADNKYVHYGTSLRIPKAGNLRGTQGMVICVGPNNSGYYIEVIRSTILNDQAGAGRNAHNEINIGVRRTDGSFTRVGPNAGKGTPWQISEDVWKDIDVTCSEYNASHYIDVFVNGTNVLSVQMAGANKLPNSGEFGVFGRGPGSVGEYDYLYAFRQTEGVDRPDQSTYLDKSRGGYVSNQWPQYVMSSIGLWGQKKPAKISAYDSYYYQEFGPLIHEVREMSVTYEKYPVIASRLYSSNDYQAHCSQFNSDNFGAKFVLLNASRDTAILNGDDAVSFGPDNVKPQHLMIYGRVVYQEDAEKYTVKNDDGVYRRGIVSVDFDNKWIQSKAAAVALGDWIVKHWSGGNDELTVELFGNPLFQLGDLVSVNSPEQDLFVDTHHYFVVAVKNSYDGGLATTLTLRRAKI